MAPSNAASLIDNSELQSVTATVGMTLEKFEGILARQVPDEQKRGKADFVIDTGCTLEKTREQVEQVVSKLETMPKKM